MQIDGQAQVGVDSLEQEDGLRANAHHLYAARRTKDGSVDWSGRPCLRDRSGGWIAGFLILRK
uniref:Uncharacterized protein n=1 Tax=Arundo donax TaxID=35708 RepID=A0A0A9DL33_ARUDO